MDEDDSVAIVTRELLETFELFSGKRVTKSQNKAIPDHDKQSFTSIITLYQCNLELLKVFRKERKEIHPDLERDNKSLKEYLKFRPREEEVSLFSNYCLNFWTDFVKVFDSIKDYLSINGNQPASKYRNKENGGSLLFRPIGLLPIIQSAIIINRRGKTSFEKIFTRFNNLDFKISSKPWRNVVWNPNEKTMIMGSNTLVKLLLVYMTDKNLMKSSELQSLKQKYADKLGLENNGAVLSDIPIL